MQLSYEATRKKEHTGKLGSSISFHLGATASLEHSSYELVSHIWNVLFNTCIYWSYDEEMTKKTNENQLDVNAKEF